MTLEQIRAKIEYWLGKAETSTGHYQHAAQKHAAGWIKYYDVEVKRRKASL